MSTTVIELSQRQAQQVNENGDYYVKLHKTIPINNGDIIDIKSVYLDTVSQSENNIILEDNVIVHTINGLYRTDWYKDGITDIVYPGGTIEPTGEDYVVYTLNQKGTLKEVKFVANNVVGGENWGNIDVKFYYIDFDTKTKKSLTVHVPEENLKTGVNSKTINIHNVELIVGSLVLATPKQTMDYANTKFAGSTQTPNGPGIYQPALFNGTFTIPKGTYQPSELAEKITDLFALNSVEGTSPINSPFLKNVNDIVGPSPVNCFNYKDKDKYANILKSSNILLGTNQVALIFNSVETKFEFTYLHFPLYDDKGNIVGGVKQKDDSKYFNAGKNGGIFFTDLSTEYETLSTPIDLFGEIMGFNMETLLVGLEDPKDVGGVDYVYLKQNMGDGVNTTNGYVGIDALINKTGENTAYKAPTAAILSTINQTIPIKAERAFNEGNNGGYFLVDIQSNGYRSGDLIDSNKVFSSISSIVSKYYSYKSYTVDTSGSIPYQHIGIPFILSGFHIRILDQNKQIASSKINDDNTIFLQIRKPLKQLESNNKQSN